ncbi:MAG: DNA primase [Flavobacteriaceae bacterium]|nr:DNA primase [Flavobacteriaceae bacterium]
MISRETIDRVLETARVEEVVGEFVHLKKSGSNFKGLSPFSNEKTPSFMVSPVKQIWKDFSSGKGGNSISFLMEYEHYSYPEAIRYLAKKYQIEIEESEQTAEEKQQISERESMYLVSEFARDEFQRNLFETEQGKAIGLTYFKERDFTEETIKKFQLGYCLDLWQGFTDVALEKGYDIKYLASTGLTIVKENNKQFDRFKGRVMFPIHSMSGRILGFGGRILTNDKKVAKYLNSPESDIYHKSKVLYGIYFAKQAIAKEDSCYLVEGYTDVISFHQAGVENVVASSGTALTEDQIRLIRRLTPNITILYDGDAAGIRASFRGIDLILEQGMNVKVLTFPDGEDPDSFARKNSTAVLKAYLEENTQDFINFKTSILLEGTNGDPVKKGELIRDIVQTISKIPNHIQREIYIRKCSQLLEISEDALFNELAQIDRKKQKESSKAKEEPQPQQALTVTKTETPTVEKIDELEKYEQEIIRILLLYGSKEADFVDYVVDEDSFLDEKPLKRVWNTNFVYNEIYLNLQQDEVEFTNPIFKEIYSEIIQELTQTSNLNIDTLINHQNREISQFVTNILMEEERYTLSDWSKKNIYVKAKEEHLDKLVTDAIFNIRRALIDRHIKSISEQLSNDSEENSTEILQEIINYTGLKKLIFDKLNRVL